MVPVAQRSRLILFPDESEILVTMDEKSQISVAFVPEPLHVYRTAEDKEGLFFHDHRV